MEHIVIIKVTCLSFTLTYDVDKSTTTIYLNNFKVSPKIILLKNVKKGRIYSYENNFVLNDVMKIISM